MANKNNTFESSKLYKNVQAINCSASKCYTSYVQPAACWRFCAAQFRFSL